LQEKKANNINLVTPSHFIPQIADAIGRAKKSGLIIPIVYNTGGYDRAEIIESFPADVFLFDLKYCDNAKADKYSQASDYFDTATTALLSAYKKTGKPKFNENGIMVSGIIVRHLLLPSSTNDAIRIIDWVEKNCPDVIFSLMAQYTPCGESDKFTELSRKITRREYDKVCDSLLRRNFYDIYVQELSSATEDFIPAFNLEGV
jgi:putative pyruvate formate lyase activating enzyme